MTTRSAASADLLLSFGPATWPHLLARAMLAEQLFRATVDPCEPSLSSRRLMRRARLPARARRSRPARRGERAGRRRSARPSTRRWRAPRPKRARPPTQVDELEQRERGSARRGRASSRAERQAAAADDRRCRSADQRRRRRAGRRLAPRVALREQRLAPAAARRSPRLLAGLATMGRRPPLLALADGASVDEVVRVRALLDATMPVIAPAQRRAAGRARRGPRSLQRAAPTRRAATWPRSRDELAERKRRDFAAARSSARCARAAALRRERVGAGDVALAGGEDARAAGGEAQRRGRRAQIAARARRARPLAPPRPFAPQGRAAAPPLAYRLPADAPVIEGLGAVSPTGVRSRGLTLRHAARRRGRRPGRRHDPASPGRFASYDGIVIIDHGGGWTSLLSNVASPIAARRPGRAPASRSAVRSGRFGVELSPKWAAMSRPLSSQVHLEALSNGAKSG